MSTNVYIGESPLQVLNIHEARHKFSAESHILIFRNKPEQKEGKRNRALIQNEIDEDRWDEIIEIPYDEKISNIQSAALTVKKVKALDTEVKSVFIGDVRNSFNRIAAFNLKPERLILLDDGSSIIHTQNRYLSEGGFFIRKKRIIFFLKNIRNYLLWKIRNPIKLCYDIFSVYQLETLETQKCFVNSYEYTGEKIRKKNLEPLKDTVFFYRIVFKRRWKNSGGILPPFNEGRFRLFFLLGK